MSDPSDWRHASDKTACRARGLRPPLSLELDGATIGRNNYAIDRVGDG